MYENLIKIENGIPVRIPVPPELWGLDEASLLDMSWADPSSGYHEMAWWPEERIDQILPPDSKFGDEILVAIPERKVVQSSFKILPMSQEEIETRDNAIKAQNRVLVVERRKLEILKGTSYQGHPIPTDAASRVNLSDLRGEALVDSSYVANFKFDDGSWSLLSNTEIKQLASTVRAYVQDCIDREIELLSAVDAFSFTQDMLEQGWPSSTV